MSDLLDAAWHAVVYALVGGALVVLELGVLDLLTPGHLGRQLRGSQAGDGHAASGSAGLVAAAWLIGTGAVVFTAIWTNGETALGEALLWTVVFGVLGIVVARCGQDEPSDGLGRVAAVRQEVVPRVVRRLHQVALERREQPREEGGVETERRARGGERGEDRVVAVPARVGTSRQRRRGQLETHAQRGERGAPLVDRAAAGLVGDVVGAPGERVERRQVRPQRARQEQRDDREVLGVARRDPVAGRVGRRKGGGRRGRDDRGRRGGRGDDDGRHGRSVAEAPADRSGKCVPPARAVLACPP